MPAASSRLTTSPFKTIPVFHRRALPFTTGRRLVRILIFLLVRDSESEERKRDRRPMGGTFLESCESTGKQEDTVYFTSGER